MAGEDIELTSKVTANVITNLATNAATSIVQAVGGKVKDEKKKVELLLGRAYTDYLTSAYNKNSQVKTLLFRRDPKNLYSFYEPGGLKWGTKTVDSSKVKNVMKINSKIIVTGTGGIGKSIMMKHFFLNCIDETTAIPILVDLRSLNNKNPGEISIYDFLYDSLTNCQFKIEKQYFEFSLENVPYLFLFDGFDEVKHDISESVAKQILDFSTKYPENSFIISSRPSIEFVSWAGFVELEAMGLTKKQAISMVRKLDYAEEIKKYFLEKLQDSLYEKHKSFASTPLLLTMMLMSFEYNAHIPERLNDFYEQVFCTLFDVHDFTKGGFKRDIKSGLGRDDFKRIFSRFCFQSFFNSQYEFTENQLTSLINQSIVKVGFQGRFSDDDYKEDLTQSVCMLIQDGLNYRFSHRSFQEYFAAVYVTGLSDNAQKKFIKSWIEQGGFPFIKTNILEILFDLQSERFINNVVYPGLVELRSVYYESGRNHFGVMKKIFKGFKIRRGENKNYTISYPIENNYLYEIICLAKIIGDFDSFASQNYPENSKTRRIEETKKLGEVFGDRFEIITFEEIQKKDSQIDFFKASPFFKIQFNYAMEKLDEIEAERCKIDGDFELLVEQL